jgi:tripartite-type tricarboxylate transporter receptor subunit TctC
LKQAFKKASGGEMRRLPATILAGALLAAPAAAQSEADYPGKPVKVIVNVAPGGGVDTATRIVAERLRARLGQPFVVENRPGAGGNIGAETVFHAEGDGYTLLASSPTPLAINGWLYKKLAFDPAGFEPVALMSRIPNVLVVRGDFQPRACRTWSPWRRPVPASSPMDRRGSELRRISPASCSWR